METRHRICVGFNLYKILNQGEAISDQSSCLWGWRGIGREAKEGPCQSVEWVGGSKEMYGTQ